MTTAANVRRSQGSRFYYPDGNPCYEVPKKSGEGTKKPTITEARALNLMPSVTTYLKMMHKPQLQDWLIEQAVLAVMSSPRKEGEKVDEFVHRILNVEKVQDQESDAAADRGSQIHDAIAKALDGNFEDEQWKLYVDAVLPVIGQLGKVLWTEKVLVGIGYAGRADILMENSASLVLGDFKTTGTIPKKEAIPKKEGYLEHRMQVAAYAKALGNTGNKRIVTALIYISTKTPGEVVVHVEEDWLKTYEDGFVPLMKVWQFANSYQPQ